MKERKANRLKDYNYSQDNLYFVTSCVHNMVCCFGDVVRTGRDLSLQHHQMILNEYGKIAERQWYWLAEQYPYIVLHEFIIMPNHMHGIIEINRNAMVMTGRDLSTNDDIDRDMSIKDGKVVTGRDLSTNDDCDRDLSINDHTNRDPSANDDNTGTGHDLSLRKIKSLSELMGAYKTTVSKKIHLLGYHEFAWQRSFHDHIIRDEKSYENISNYIINNPNVWEKDKFYNNTI